MLLMTELKMKAKTPDEKQKPPQQTNHTPKLHQKPAPLLVLATFMLLFSHWLNPTYLNQMLQKYDKNKNCSS